MSDNIVPDQDSALVVLNGAEAVTSSLTIAAGTGTQHKNVLELIRSNLADFEAFGPLAFETRIAGQSPNPTKIALLTEPQATLLLTFMRNTEVVKRFKVALVKAFFELRERAARQPALDVSEVTRRDLAVAILEAEDRADAAEAANKVLTSRIEKDAPLVAKAEAHTVSDSVVHRQEFAREVMAWGVKAGVTIKQADVMRFLGHIGLFIRGERTDTGHATAEAMKRGLAFTDKGTAKNGHAWATGKLTARGQDYAWKRIISFVEANGTLELPRQLRGGDPA